MVDRVNVSDSSGASSPGLSQIKWLLCCCPADKRDVFSDVWKTWHLVEHYLKSLHFDKSDVVDSKKWRTLIRVILWRNGCKMSCCRRCCC